MSIFKSSFKPIALILFVIIFFSTLQAKNLNKFNEGSYVSDYFSGILLLNDNQYNDSYIFLKKLDGLEASHLNYSSKYLYSLVNLGKFNEAFNYSKKLEERKLDNFESDLITGVYYLKNNNHDLAQKYFLKLKNRKSSSVLNNFVSNALLNWLSLKNLDLNIAQNKINAIDSRFENLKDIQNVFLHCFYKSEKTEFFFEELVLNQKIDFSRYNYFYAAHLINIGKIEKAKKILIYSLELYPRNLLLNQYKLDLNNGKHEKNFNCQNLPDIVAEIFYITANALSSQDVYTFSNFYLNLSKYLNNDFYSLNTLLAENFYKTDNFTKAKKIYKEMSKQGEAFFWYSAKQNAKIFIKEGKKEKALKLITNTYEKLSEKNIYETFDYATFLKNNDQFEDSIKLYTEIIKKIKKDHPLYPKVKDGRGVAYERIGEWDKAEKDLLSSLDSSPDQAYVINYLAYSWIEQGVKVEESLKMLEKANNLKSNDPYIIDSLGWALFKLKRYEDAKHYLQLAVKLMPSDPIVNDHYGDVLWKSGNKIQARYYWSYVLNLEDTEKDLKNNIKNKLILGL
ncbi:tetratricopeptide repeat protein [Pelagibacterales bacterium SAG-MED29]|nr:tetratricopeptide repeat protein [Pelagibacterales bacterium SAG-MED29]